VALLRRQECGNATSSVSCSGRDAPSSNGVSGGPKITAFHKRTLLSSGAADIPDGGSFCMLQEREHFGGGQQWGSGASLGRVSTSDRRGVDGGQRRSTHREYRSATRASCMCEMENECSKGRSACERELSVMLQGSVVRLRWDDWLVEVERATLWHLTLVECVGLACSECRANGLTSAGPSSAVVWPEPSCL
jgi:hypothetical protein